MSRSTKIAYQLRRTIRAVSKRGALPLFAMAIAVSVIPQLGDDRAFAADSPTVVSLEQKSQQVEKMLLIGVGLPLSETNHQVAERHPCWAN